VLSENSVNSLWVEREVQAAFEKERRQGSIVLFPVRLDDAVMDCSRAWAADIRRTRHIGDFSNWKDHGSYQEAFQCLIADLKSADSKSK
jgi:TIR domain